VEIHFPIEVPLAKICLHAGCGGNLYAMKKIKLQAVEGDKVSDLAQTAVVGPDTFISFESCSTNHLRLSIQAGEEGAVMYTISTTARDILDRFTDPSIVRETKVVDN
jgi:hypothetical protein